MIKRIIEVGIAVRDLSAARKRLTEILGARAGGMIESSEFNMVAQMLRIGNIEFELMQPAHEAGIISDFLKKRGEGLHHLAFEVDDMKVILDFMKKQNVKVINEITVGGIKAAFLHPASFQGVLFELIEGVIKHVDNEILPTDLQAQIQIQGIGVEGILEVGIFVNDLAAMRDFYSKALLCEPSEIVNLEPLSMKIARCRIGNVCLSLIEVKEGRNKSRDLFGKNQTGLNHVTLKVSNIQSAIGYLKSKGVDFNEDPMGLHDSKSILIHPKELSGVPILLKDGFYPLEKNPL
jgi:methylmalonyl-CoA/ethylmalonyl-CoA epimerase